MPIKVSDLPDENTLADTTLLLLTNVEATAEGISRKANLAKLKNYTFPTKTELDNLGIDAGTVNELTVETAVPTGAVFTDTTYSDLSEFNNDEGFITGVNWGEIGGTQANIELGDFGNTAGFETSTDLDTRDTANRNRDNHTGTQLAETISDFDTAVANAGGGGGGGTVNWSDIGGTQADIELGDFGNTAGFETSTDLDTRDTANRNRDNHTGTQLAETISDFDTAVANAGGGGGGGGTVNWSDIGGTQADIELGDFSNTVGFQTPTELILRDTNNRSRGNHTGTQVAATISNFDTAVASVTGRTVAGSIDFVQALNIGPATSYLVLGNAGQYKRISSTFLYTVIVPNDTRTNFPVATEIELEQAGTGQIAVTPETGVTLNYFEGLKSAGQFWVITLKKVAANEWTLIGGTNA